MSLATVIKRVIAPIVCSSGAEAAPGTAVRLTLNTLTFPTLPDTVDAVVQSPVLQARMWSPGLQDHVCGREYILSYEVDDLDGAYPALTDSMIESMECMSCCDLLSENLVALQAALAAEVNTRTAADLALQANITAEAAARIAADLLLLPRPLIRTAAQGAPLNAVTGLAQIERLTATGLVTVAGNALVVVTSAALPGSPRAYNVPVLVTDGPEEILIAAEAVLSADSELLELFDVVLTATYLDLVTKVDDNGFFPANDATLQIRIEDNTSTGVDTVLSTNQQAGIASSLGTVPLAVGQGCHVGDLPGNIDIYVALRITPALWALTYTAP